MTDIPAARASPGRHASAGSRAVRGPDRDRRRRVRHLVRDPRPRRRDGRRRAARVLADHVRGLGAVRRRLRARVAAARWRRRSPPPCCSTCATWRSGCRSRRRCAAPAAPAGEAQLAVDESWAVAQRDGRVDRDRLVGAGLVLFVAWFGGTVTGVLGGSALGDPADYGLDAMFPALFLALLVGQLDGPRARVAALAGALIALALTPLLPAGPADRRGRRRRAIALRCGDDRRLDRRRRRRRRHDRDQGAPARSCSPSRPLPGPLALVMPLLAPCLLAALVVSQTLADGRALVIDARARRRRRRGRGAAAARAAAGRARAPPPAWPPRPARSAPPNRQAAVRGATSPRRSRPRSRSAAARSAASAGRWR